MIAKSAPQKARNRGKAKVVLVSVTVVEHLIPGLKDFLAIVFGAWNTAFNGSMVLFDMCLQIVHPGIYFSTH